MKNQYQLVDLNKFLQWYKRNPKLPTTPDDRGVRKLVYQSDGRETEMGLVCETAGGKYWAFTTASTIVCMPMERILIEYAKADEAAAALYAYVLSELERIVVLNFDQPYIVTRKFKRRDREAFSEYKPAITDAGTAFKCGIDWALRSEGMPRRPSWALFLVQNRDGSYTWFENQPQPNDRTGRWEVKEGRSKDVALSDNWRAGIRRLT